MIVDSVLINAKAYFKGQIVDCCIAVEEGKIHKLGKETQMPNADEKLDLHNLLVLPGLIDEHVHLRDEGKAYKEDFFSGTSAAAAGGFTTVLDMPNNEPVTMSVDSFRNRLQIAKRKILVNVGFYSAFPKTLSEINSLVTEGVVGFKFFMNSPIGGLDIDDDLAINEAFKIVSELKVPIAVHAEDRSLISAKENKLKKVNKNTCADYLNAHTEDAELISIKRLLKIANGVDVKLHFCHITSKEGLGAIEEGKEVNNNLTCEVTPNHLFLSADDLRLYGSLLIMAPPLRGSVHTRALWQGLETGLIDTIGSDHAPHMLSEKIRSNIWDVNVGVPGLETTLPLLLTSVHKNQLSLNQVVCLLAEKPAKIFGLTDRGSLEKGKNADITIVDYKQQFKIDASKFKSKARFSPYEKWDVYGKPVKTIINGVLVFDQGNIVSKGGVGEIVRGSPLEVHSR